MICFNKNNRHTGRLEVIGRFPVDTIADVDAAVRWCSKCGAIVIDKEVDGRLMNSFVRMKFPEVTRKALKNENIRNS